MGVPKRANCPENPFLNTIIAARVLGKCGDARTWAFHCLR
jgi:hypothetical protein